MTKNIVIGIGNILLNDDGIGVYAALYLEKNYTFEPPLQIIDGGTLGIRLIEYINEYDNIFLIDTISIDDKIGSVYVLPSDELLNLNRYRNTAHEVEVVDMLQTASLLDKKANVTIFGIVPSDIQTVKIGLNKELVNKFNLFINIIINKIQELNIKVTIKNTYLLKDIINETSKIQKI